MTTKIVVIGGGFAGVKCAKALRKQLSTGECEITLIASENHMVFHPLLAEVASAAINPKDMAAPLRAILKDVHVCMADVKAIDLEKSEIRYETIDGAAQTLKYDQVVVACGNTANLAVIPGMADHAFPMKKVGDALDLQLHVINQMERAETCKDPAQRKRILTFVVVGGGFSGVEVAGEIHDFVTRSASYYSNFGKSDIDVVLVHSRDQILPEVSSSLREFARVQMVKNGVRFILNTGASFCSAEGVGLKDGQFINSDTVVCTIGTRPSPIVERLSVPKDHGRIHVNADMSIPGFDNAWAIGDCAAVPNAFDNALSPTTGQFAERQGAQVAANVCNKMKGGATKPFSHRSLGVLCSIGGRKAVAESMGLKISGTLAWMAWRGTYLMKLPSVWQQIGVGLTWFFGMWFPPALTGLRTDPSRRIGNAHYKAGDWIFKRGEPANEFCMVKNGQVEIINELKGQEYVIAALGTGDFCGEASFADGAAHAQSCRAKTDVELLVMGKSVLEQISQSLPPLQTAITDAMKRRQVSWEVDSQLKTALDSMPLSEFIESIDIGKLGPAANLQDAISLMNSETLDVLYVVGENGKLEGLVTRTDLLRALESNAHLSTAECRNIPAQAFMVSSPIVASENESPTTTILTMREHGLKRIPVVNNLERNILVGSVRAERVIASIMDRVVERDMVQS